MKIFQPDNFSEAEIRYRELNDILFFVPEVLDHYFSDYCVKAVFQLDRPEINSENYKIIMTRAGKEQTYLLRRFKVLKNRRQINFYLGLLIKLEKRGAKVSHLIKNKKSQLSTKTKEGVYSLFKFIEAEYFSPDRASLKSAARAIAQIHQCFNWLSPEDTSQINILSRKSLTYFNKVKNYSLNDFVQIKNIIKKKKNKTKIEVFVLKNIIFFQNIVKEIAHCHPPIKKLPKQIIHSDLHPHNLLIKDKEVAAIVDFDGIRISQQARDVAFAIYRLGRQFFINRNLAAARKEAPLLRNLFIEEYQKIKKLSAEEVRLMLILLKDEFIRKLLFVLKGVYLEDNNTWAKDLPKFLVAFEEINYFWP